MSRVINYNIFMLNVRLTFDAGSKPEVFGSIPNVTITSYLDIRG